MPSGSREGNGYSTDHIPMAEIVVDHHNYPISNGAFVEASQVQ